MDLSRFMLDPDNISIVGVALHRPECIWTDADGIWVSDSRGGVARLDDAGQVTLLGSGIGETNGFSRRPDGSFVAAGLNDGKAHRIAPDGTMSVLLDAMDGQSLGSVNCVTADGPDRLWISVMTRRPHWPDALLDGRVDGYVMRVDQGIPTIVADGLNIANEVKVSPDGRHLYVAESGARRIVRFPIKADASLGPREPVGPDDLGYGAFVDGFSFDSWGNIWVTVITHNGLILIQPDGRHHVVYQDIKRDALDTFVAAVETRSATPKLMIACIGDGVIKMPTSVAFDHGDPSRVYIGSLATPYITSFRLS